MVDSSSTTAMPVVIILYERGRSGNIFSTGDFKRGGRPGDGELHGGLHGAVHELEQVQGILHLHGIKLLQVGQKTYFREATKNCVFFYRIISSGGSTMAVVSALVPLVKPDRRISLA